MAMGVGFKVLGPLELEVDGTSVPLGGAREQLVLAALLLDANRVVPVERIVDWVWGEDGSGRQSTLQVHVSNLRRRLTEVEPSGRSLIETRRPGYVIELADEELDVLRFHGLRRTAEASLDAGQLDQACGDLRAAVALWRGEPLAGLPLNGGALAEVNGLIEARALVVRQLAEAELLRGRHAQVVEEMARWLADRPLDEQLRAQYMLALYRCGRQADALAVFQEGRNLLLEELGIDPSKALRDLEGQILNQDPALDAPRPGRPGPDVGGATVLRSSMVMLEAHLEVGDRTYVLRPGITTIGRRDDRDVVLDDPAASRIHAEIRTTPEACELVDTVSANGTRVGGTSVQQHILRDGDVIEIGDTQLRFVLGRPPA